MIRGVIGTVPWHAVEVGRFYMSSAYGAGAWLFQCIRMPEKQDAAPVTKALVFTIGGETELSLKSLPQMSLLVALYDVHVRIDPTSLNHHFDAGLFRFLLVGDQPIICASHGSSHGWQRVNLVGGRYFTDNEDHNAVSFDRWSLVLDDDTNEELTIASFDALSPPKRAP